MRRSKLVAVGGVLASYVWVLAGGCSSSEDSGAKGNSSGGVTNMMMDASSGSTTIMPDAMGLGGSSGMQLNLLCGDAPIDQQCVPDDARACANYRPPVIEPPVGVGGEGGSDAAGGGGGEGGGPGAGGAEASSGGAGLAGETSSGGMSSGGMSGGSSGGADGGSAGGASEGGGAGEGSPPLAPARYGCQVTRVDNVTGRSCQLAGEGALNAPCFSAADCQAGLACVTEGQAGRCLSYCCGGDGICEPGTYCAEHPLRKPLSDTSGIEAPRVPVCVPADDCSLEETFPCPSGNECRCKGDTACLVVRDDGTTSCRVPGAGKQGEVCPCAWNHVCSSVTNTCVKICSTDPSKNDCGQQKCQAAAELPQNFGVCVGPVN